MRAFSLIAIIAGLIGGGVFALLYFLQYSGLLLTSTDVTRPKPGNGIVREKTQEIATEKALTGGSGFTWKDSNLIHSRPLLMQTLGRICTWRVDTMRRSRSCARRWRLIRRFITHIIIWASLFS